MKCKHCGAEISLEQKFCPYCGAPNDQAMQHASDMEHFRKDYAETKTDVYTKSKKFSGVAVRVVILAILIVATIGVTLYGVNYGSFYRHGIRAKSNKNFEEYSKKMDRYLEDGQYVEFDAFVESHAIWPTYDDPYEDYMLINRFCSYYSTAQEELMNFHTETDPDMLQSYSSLMIQAIEGYYSTFHDDSSLSEDDLKSDPYYEDICKVTDTMDELLVAELNLSSEDAASLRTLSEGKRSVLLEDAVGKIMAEKTGASSEDVENTQSESGM
ncbi:MAG: zinc ribbon domain-containing protein [Eubacterium sp.]|nr:zinc ribbon domain-containing protein [Eubacterium sp.]